MFGEHRYSVRTTWTGDRGTGTSGYRDYDRSTTIEIDGKPVLAASSDKPFRGDPSRWNPEDMLLAALSQCHLLSYLHACVTVGVVVVAYEDHATGTMVEDGRGGGAFTEVVLRPRVTIAEESMRDAAHQAHGKANEWCFIANSVNFPVRHEPVIDVAARGNPVAAAGNAGAAGGNPGEAEQKSREAG
jgi:organic hydroperoxide reductase OsmC/OhrA